MFWPIKTALLPLSISPMDFGVPLWHTFIKPSNKILYPKLWKHRLKDREKFEFNIIRSHIYVYTSENI